MGAYEYSGTAIVENSTAIQRDPTAAERCKLVLGSNEKDRRLGDLQGG
jgi:hypothetical protein